MNLSGFIDEDNAAFQQFDVNVTEQPRQPGHYIRRYVTHPHLVVYFNVMTYVCPVLGGPGNILSAIVWLRRHVTSKNSSAVYLAVLAINDLVFLIVNTYVYVGPGWHRVARAESWLYYSIWIVMMTTTILEPLLVLGFSVERLIAISFPLQVRSMRLQ